MSAHFVIPRKFEHLLDELPKMSVNTDYPYSLGGAFTWAAQSWLVLREFRDGFTIGCEPLRGVINFAHCRTWRDLGSRAGEFRVSVRADHRRLFDVDFEIVQNPGVPLTPLQAFLIHWPQPRLIARSPSRTGVRTIGYVGVRGRRNLAPQLHPERGAHPAFHGFDFEIVGRDRWHDMSQLDVLVAVRSFNREAYPDKPPSKLINAWAAGIPLIAGCDSAFDAVGNWGSDYLRVSSERELADAVRMLADDPRLYADIVAKGRERAESFTQEAVARQWLEVFDRKIGPVFEAKASGARRRQVISVPKILDYFYHMPVRLHQSLALPRRSAA